MEILSSMYTLLVRVDSKARSSETSNFLYVQQAQFFSGSLTKNMTLSILLTGLNFTSDSRWQYEPVRVGGIFADLDEREEPPHIFTKINS